MEKVLVPNRDGNKLAVVIEQSENQKGLVFVMHGQGGFKEQPHVRTFIESFLEQGFTAISFDVAHTIGESEGNMEDASITSYYSDLEDIINWSQGQEWYQDPFVLVGHSLGGICTALYAENYPEKVLGLAPISTVVSGKLSWEVTPKKELEEWKRTGIKSTESNSKPGVMKRLKWSNMEDRLQYDLLEKVDQLTMPVLLIVGSEDDRTPAKHQQLLYDALPADKELYVIEGAPHTFRDPKHLAEIKQHFNQWIQKFYVRPKQ